LKTEDAGEMAGGGRSRHVGGDGVVGEHWEGRAHPLGYPAWREAVCGGAATVAGGGDGDGTVAAVLRRRSEPRKRLRRGGAVRER
jgi:hypothetical protein